LLSSRAVPSAQAEELYHVENRYVSQFVKVRDNMTNVKEFREEESTLSIALFLSKNLYHLILSHKKVVEKWKGEDFSTFPQPLLLLL
jgi:hypothetical protein